MLGDDAVLRDDVRFAGVGGDAEVPEDRPRVDALVDAQERHADVAVIARRLRPETAVGVAILGADARVHHERAEPRNREDTLGEQRLAARDDEIRTLRADERFGLFRVRRRDDQLRRIRPLRIGGAQPLELAPLPRAIGRRLRHHVVRAEREHVEKPPEADALDLARDPLAQPAARLANHHDAGQRRKGSEPAREPLAIEIRALVADEECAHAASTSRCRDTRPAGAIRKSAAARDR